MSSSSSSISSLAFRRLVGALKHYKKTCTVIESSCGGLINSNILAQPGASQVYWGGSSYNTKKAKPFLLNDEALHTGLIHKYAGEAKDSSKARYIESKLDWTRQTALAFCNQVGTDVCIAEGGATGPTFRPNDLDAGFAVLAVAARSPQTGEVSLVQQHVFESSHADREANMRLFADEAAKLAVKAIQELYAKDDMSFFDETRETNSLQEEISQRQHSLDRATQLRTDVEALNSMSKVAHYVVLHRHFSLFAPPSIDNKNTDPSENNRKKQNRRLAFLSLDQLDSLCHNNDLFCRETSFLGILDGDQPIFAVDLIGNDTKIDNQNCMELLSEKLAELSPGASLEDTRSMAPLLDPLWSDNELVLHATALAQWQRRSLYCASCGSKTILADGGTCRVCQNTESCNNRRTWPRQDPSMIVVVGNREGDRVLLARSKRHPRKVHTALAGFVEAGETMERAVAREVYEEVGIRIDVESVRYIASQPWPFPQSTMIGFIATADEKSQTFVLDENEIVSAEWFSRKDVLEATKIPGAVMQNSVVERALEANAHLNLLIPPKGVLARTLIETWLNKDT